MAAIGKIQLVRALRFQELALMSLRVVEDRFCQVNNRFRFPVTYMFCDVQFGHLYIREKSNIHLRT